MLLNIIWQAIRRQWEINREQIETDRRIIDIVESVGKTVQLTGESLVLIQRLQTERDKPAQEEQPSLLSAIKGLFR